MKKHSNITFALVCLLGSMLFLTLASGPIYSLFCKATGFGGTPRISNAMSLTKGKRNITVRFDANISPELPWLFIPKQKMVTVRPGENVLIFYYAENNSKNDIIGTAVYNVTPAKAGQYFNKVHCFCFEEQLLRSGAKVMMPVSFYLSPELENDPEMDDVEVITLSYSFFKVR